MRHRRSVLLILLLLAGSLSPPDARGQDARATLPVERVRGFSLEQNYPNPVNPETWIQFSLEDDLFLAQDSAVVTIRIFNSLRGLVAIPQAVDQARRGRVPILNLTYRAPGQKLAYWDGKDAAGRRVPTGVYYCEMVVEGHAEKHLRKLIVVNEERRRRIIPWLRKP